ncbi:MAG: hypothetical protein WC694_01075 [Candidatus Paceibacterota bacterium]|jgi:prefoldin subunit 5
MIDGFKLNPGKLHDKNFDKKTGASVAYEEMERLQKILKKLDEEIESSEEFMMRLEKHAEGLRQRSPHLPQLKDMEVAIRNGRKELDRMIADKNILVEEIENLFDAHRTFTEALESMDENTNKGN